MRGWGAQQPFSPPNFPPECLHNPANPSSCLALPFLAKITPEHVSTLSCKESHFGEAFSLSLFPFRYKPDIATLYWV